jgi:hypothetical protein
MMMHNDPSGVLSSCDLLVDITDDSNRTMVKQHQSDSHQYHHHHQHHSDSSRSSSVCSTSLSPKTSSSTTATTTASTTSVVPAATATAALTDIDPLLAQHVEYELGLTKKNGGGSGTRKNAWGNLSYAELISKAITSSVEQRLTLSEIYDWMIKYVPFFRNKVDRISSAGWKVTFFVISKFFLQSETIFFLRIPFVTIYHYTIDSNVYKAKVLVNHLGG